MQDQVREIVLDYLRAQDVAFEWRRGFVHIPDARRIGALASGRPTLTFTFDRELAQARPELDFVTFGHPVFEQIREELKDSTAYTERYFGCERVHIYASEPPYLRWDSQHSPPTRTEQVARECDQLLVLRFQLDIESDFRHQETFPVVVDLSTGEFAPAMASLAGKADHAKPPAFRCPAATVSEQEAVQKATQHAAAEARHVLMVLQREADDRVREAVEAAKRSGNTQNYLEHYKNEQLSKARLLADLRLVAVERWFVEKRIELSVRVEGWPLAKPAFQVLYDVAGDSTYVPDIARKGTSKARLFLRICQAGHIDGEPEDLGSCAACGKHFCAEHLETCDVDGKPYCEQELASCSDTDHNGRVLATNLQALREGVTLCRLHRQPCGCCGEMAWKRELVECEVSQAVLCPACQRTCDQCNRVISVRLAVTCERSEGTFCSAHSATCSYETCKKKVGRPHLEELGDELLCREHLFSCHGDHRALVDVAQSCAITAAKVCPEHAATCRSCSRTVVSALTQASALSGTPVCPECLVRCAECTRPFGPEELGSCERSGVPLCPEDKQLCGLPGCALTVARSGTEEFDGARVCVDHLFDCEGGHRALVDQRQECSASGVSICEEHRTECGGCGEIVFTPVLFASEDSGTLLCPRCGSACSDCGRFFENALTEVCAESGLRYCQEHLVTCSRDGCRRRLAKSVAVFLEESKPLCLGHVAICESGPRSHPVSDDRARTCVLSGELACFEHSRVCATCDEVVANRLAVASTFSETTLCGRCASWCMACARPFGTGEGETCKRSEVPYCQDHITRCELEECGFSIGKAIAQEVEGKRYCPEHVFMCELGHLALRSDEVMCAATAASVCRTHSRDCPVCNKTVSQKAVVRSAGSGNEGCETCLVRCTDCERPFEPSELARCELSGEQACPDCLVACSLESCERTTVRRKATLPDPRATEASSAPPVCREHVFECAAAHPALLKYATTCPVTADRVCPDHAEACAACERTVASACLEPSVLSDQRICPDCRGDCAECNSLVERSALGTCFRSGVAACPNCLVSCQLEECHGQQLVRSRSKSVDGQVVCAEHVFPCAEDHEALLQSQVKCPTSGVLVCREHSTSCAECQRSVATRSVARSALTGDPLCQDCRVGCEDCHSTVPRSALVSCPRSQQMACPRCLIACEHSGCDLMVRRKIAQTVSDLNVCPQHVVACDDHLVLHQDTQECQVSGARLCAAHILACAACGRRMASRIGEASGQTGQPLCPTCRVSCTDCKQYFEREHAAKCDLTGQTFCHDHLVACEHAGCSKRIWRGSAQVVEGRSVCPQHVYRCSEGHPALRQDQAACAVTGKPVCPTHSVHCVECNAAMLSKSALRSATSKALLCPKCAVWCFECSQPFLPDETGLCGLSNRQCCLNHIARCEHEGCDRRIRPGVAETIDGRRVCSNHKAKCALNPRHVTLEDMLQRCPGDPKEAEGCDKRLCQRPEHRCAKCEMAVCPDHRRKALGEKRPRYCPPCLNELPQCPTCNVPMSRADGRCALCTQVGKAKFTGAEAHPGREILEQCTLTFPWYGHPWRTASYRDGNIWEVRTRFGTVRIVKLGKNPGVYEKRLGILSALGAWLRGG